MHSTVLLVGWTLNSPISPPPSSFKNTIIALLGFLFWLVLGSITCHDASEVPLYEKKMKAMGSLAIINSFIYAAEGVLHALNLKSGDE